MQIVVPADWTRRRLRIQVSILSTFYKQLFCPNILSQKKIQTQNCKQRKVVNNRALQKGGIFQFSYFCEIWNKFYSVYTEYIASKSFHEILQECTFWGQKYTFLASKHVLFRIFHIYGIYCFKIEFLISQKNCYNSNSTWILDYKFGMQGPSE